MTALRVDSAPPSSAGTRPQSDSPNAAPSLAQSPAVSAHSSSLSSPSTAASSTAASAAATPPALPTNDEVEAVIKMATSTRPTPDGRPPPGKDTRTQLFTGNLPYRVRWQDLKDLFRRAGTVLRADVSLSPDNRSRGYGTVLLASAEDAGRAVDMFNGYSWQGRVLEVRLDRLGGIGGDLEAGLGAGTGMALGLGAGTGVQGMRGLGAVNASNGLHVPAPHAPLPFVSQHISGSGAASSVASSSPLSTINPGLLALHQQQQQQEDLLASRLGSLSSFGGLGSYNGLGSELERERSRSSAGMRSLFVGNLPFHCQWQDLKDLFRQAGTILRADVSLGADGRSRGFGTVSFANEIDAERAVIMFNGYEYNGRILKVHYDKFCAQTPLQSNISPQSSTLSTPVQPVSTQAALLQAVQLQQLMAPQGSEWYNNSGVSNNYGGNSASNLTTNGVSLQALRESLYAQSQQSHPVSTTSSTGDSPASLFNAGAGVVSSLAERRQKVPAPIASAPSRRSDSGGGASGVHVGVLSVSTALSNNTLGRTSSSPISPKRSRLSESFDYSFSKLESTSAPIPKETSSQGTASSSSPSGATHSTHSTSATSSTSPRASHPAHPGPIALPPPPSVGAFPPFSPGHPHLHSHQHPLSPVGHPMSPVGMMYPYYTSTAYSGPMSPAYPHAHQYISAHAQVTPHGLPPITPSMPSFSFVPQLSPSGSGVMSPPPAEGAQSTSMADGYSGATNSYDSSSSINSMTLGMGMGMVSPPMHLPHHVFQPFTPGTTMSPGSFWGRPGGGGAVGGGGNGGVSQAQAPYLNPAVGSPVLMHPPYGFAHVGSQPASPAIGAGDEPSGYFPPVRSEGYFPPVSMIGSSGLANEILKEGSTMDRDNSPRLQHARSDSGGWSEREAGGETETEADGRAQSSSSGATSWRSSEENVLAAGGGAKGNMSTLAGDIASLRLGSPPYGRRQREHDSPSYARAVEEGRKVSSPGVQRAESDDGSSGGTTQTAVRHASMGAEGAQRPVRPQKTHSDETGKQGRPAAAPES
ncbi:hypothetical protein M0805_001252 [Coniferiporia weirii]|nr:hypothetical protein M0805_001252 [Coniferiporia weirii]